MGFGGDFLLGFFKGLFNGDNPLKRGWHEAVNGVKIDAGLFAADTKQSGWGWQLFSRFTWQLPQTVLGWGFADIDNNFGKVTNVDYYAGATVLTGGHNGLLWGHGGPAMTLGNYIMGNNEIRADPNNRLLQHEYGHYIQSQSSGWFYLSKYAIPSLLSVGDYDLHPVEQDANIRALKYFHRNISGYNGWVFGYNPIKDYDETKSYEDTSNQYALEKGHLGLSWYDYLMSPFGLVVHGLINSFILNKNQ